MNTRELAKEILISLKEKRPERYKKVTIDDIHRIIKYYNTIMVMIIRIGGFINLPIYNNKQDTRCIKIEPKHHKIYSRKKRIYDWLDKNK